MVGARPGCLAIQVEDVENAEAGGHEPRRARGGYPRAPKASSQPFEVRKPLLVERHELPVQVGLAAAQRLAQAPKLRPADGAVGAVPVVDRDLALAVDAHQSSAPV